VVITANNANKPNAKTNKTGLEFLFYIRFDSVLFKNIKQNIQENFVHVLFAAKIVMLIP
jgi:hypothetical protein